MVQVYCAVKVEKNSYRVIFQCFCGKPEGYPSSWWSWTSETQDKSPGKFRQWWQQSVLYLIQHADVTLIPGALSHICHVTRNWACETIIHRPLLCIRLHTRLGYLTDVKSTKQEQWYLYFIKLTKGWPLTLCLCFSLSVCVLCFDVLKRSFISIFTYMLKHP